VELDHLLGDEQLSRDHLVRVALGDRQEELLLTSGEPSVPAMIDTKCRCAERYERRAVDDLPRLAGNVLDQNYA
jgi:hypothetical protein